MNFVPIPPEVLAKLLQAAAAESVPEGAIPVPGGDDEIPMSEMEACISANGQMPPLPPLLDDDTLRAMDDRAMAFLARVITMASVAFAHLRQKHDFDEALRQLVVVERHLLQRQGDLGELH